MRCTAWATFGRVRPRRPTPSGSGLPIAVIVWRAAHALIALGFLASIAYIWWCALTRRRGRVLHGVIAGLAAEGALVAANRGDCPLGPLGVRIGDPVPLFDLVLPPRVSKIAIPVLGVVTAVGVGLLGVRPPRGPSGPPRPGP